MNDQSTKGNSLEHELRRAIVSHDLTAFGALLSDDVTWGDVDTPRGCRSRHDVLALLAGLFDGGVDARVVDMVSASAGIVGELDVTWPQENQPLDEAPFFHVYFVRDGSIYRIERFDDRTSACEAARLSI